MMLRTTITKENFRNLWTNNNDLDLSVISDNFYDYYQDEDLKINPTRLESYWVLNVSPIIENLCYEITRWKKVNDFDLKSKYETNFSSNLNGITNQTDNSNSTNNTTNTNTGNNTLTSKEGYGGFSLNNQTGQFRTDINSTVSNSNNTEENRNESTNTSNNTNKVDQTSLTSNVSTDIREVRLWLENNYETIKTKYFDKIKLALFIEVW